MTPCETEVLNDFLTINEHVQIYSYIDKNISDNSMLCIYIIMLYHDSKMSHPNLKMLHTDNDNINHIILLSYHTFILN